MPDYQWPDPEHRTLIGGRTLRVDSPDKVSGRARYTYDTKRPGLLFGKVVRSPYASCKIVSIDTTAAEKMPGVKAIEIVQKAGSTIHWAGDDIVIVAAVDENTAEDAARAVKVKYQKLAHLVSDAEPPAGAAEAQGPLSIDDISDMLDNQVPDNQIGQPIGLYGASVIVHCCMESQGSISEWPDPEHLFVHMSTQNVSGIAGQMAEPLKMQ